eukprot:TRINITY_DN17198_c0_g1_i1.p1 TRINITY_DN17198_c0_g1~~TRINITY_DN17198_c0_g1_i1.p1  ORF type:complete len:479 (-),score=114.93 TRINITY_DN17198_c0_g1_i1:30-1466(-)
MSGKCGFVFKEGAQIYSWKKRFFVIEIDQGKISYYTKDDKKTKKGEIVIKTIKAVKRYNDYKGRKYVFGVITTTGRTFFVQATDDESVDSWMNAIKEVSGLNPPPQVNSTPTKTVTSTYSQPSYNQPQTGYSQPSYPQSSYQPPAPAAAPQVEKVSVDDFETLKVIGRGGFGRVLLVRKKDNRKVYAMKVLKKSMIAARGEVEHTRTEKSVLAKVDHPFLAKLYWSFQTEDSLYLIMDFINGGELFHHLSQEKSFAEERAKFYAAQIISGMEYLHGHGVIYRDLKPENILLSSAGNVVMTDFGLSKEGLSAADSRTATFCGTPEYLAPEIIKGEDYTKAIDWWSVGTLIYEMLTGLPPFYTEDEENMYHKIMTADLVFPSYFSPEVSDIISLFLKRDPKERLQDPNKIKSHPWFNNIDWTKLVRLQIQPPFVPHVKNEEDVANIDDEFLQEDINAEDDGVDAGPVDKDAFANFTFAGQ